MTTGGAAAAASRRRGWLAVLGAWVALLAACSADRPTPAALETFTPKIGGSQVWSARIGKVDFPLTPVVRDGQFIVAGGDGSVVALRASDGRELWRGSVNGPITAGVGSDGRIAAVVTAANRLEVLDRGRPLWSAQLSSRTATAPLVAGERIFVVGVDRVVHAFDAMDGRRLWRFARAGEALTLAHPAVLAPYQNTLLAGQGAVLTGLDPTTGVVRWEVALSPPRGTNEVERLNDLVGPPLRVSTTVCARAFQTAVGCIDAERHVLRWSRVVGGVQALGGDAELVFGGDSSDRVSAWRMASGDLVWTHDRLVYRGLSAPLALGRTVVFGDFEGQLHFMARDDGQTLLRLPTDGSAVAAPPLLADQTILVVTRNGGVFGFRTE